MFCEGKIGILGMSSGSFLDGNCFNKEKVGK